VVFIPKYRRKTLYQELRRRLGEIFRRLALQKESKVVAYSQLATLDRFAVKQSNAQEDCKKKEEIDDRNREAVYGVRDGRLQ
jgi:hypothetical protein